jgi:hypothetical protein
MSRLVVARCRTGPCAWIERVRRDAGGDRRGARAQIGGSVLGQPPHHESRGGACRGYGCSSRRARRLRPVIRTVSPEAVVLDASAMVDLVTGEGTADPIRLRLRGTAIRARTFRRRGAFRAAPEPRPQPTQVQWDHGSRSPRDCQFAGRDWQPQPSCPTLGCGTRR